MLFGLQALPRGSEVHEKRTAVEQYREPCQRESRNPLRKERDLVEKPGEAFLEIKVHAKYPTPDVFNSDVTEHTFAATLSIKMPIHTALVCGSRLEGGLGAAHKLFANATRASRPIGTPVEECCEVPYGIRVGPSSIGPHETPDRPGTPRATRR